MEMTRRYQRPPFEDALAVWRNLLAQRGFSTDLLWILEENLCFEKDPGTPARVKLGFQTRFSPHPPDAAKVTYHHFAELDCAAGVLSPRNQRGPLTLLAALRFVVRAEGPG